MTCGYLGSVLLVLHGDTETRRHGDTETRRNGGTEEQRGFGMLNVASVVTLIPWRDEPDTELIIKH